ncbi:LNS2-domain-containing protein [Sodiomyces alkalinus F11]|uniref:LNS2-domain-containing protein n=1 Tax=Sodiomyces alkalinus (strain CBS 110278 / VKM F-3762 / F11) TaxID=1314773 RepID=A0A3N2PYP3_SODAK|nr:LNS2-domain-containing protein [Sodiomyces alkalinus F11]ROT39548.1 LNS2-domain-containing protein [Sodiomyces alkalinus F11]
MQYVRNLSDSVSSAWNSINPATLSGAIDVIVVEQEDGSLACSPFHVRFGKFSLLRPYEKKVDFRVNGVKQPYPMKLGEEGEAFFIFETSDTIPKDLQTSPLVSPASSPPLNARRSPSPGLQEPDLLELDDAAAKSRRPGPSVLYSTSALREDGILASATSTSTPGPALERPRSGDWSHVLRSRSNDFLGKSSRSSDSDAAEAPFEPGSPRLSTRSQSPPPLPPTEAVARATALSEKLSAANIPCEVTETGDLKLDMTMLKTNEEDVFRAEIMARKILSQELEGNYDIGALFGMDEQGNIWIYSSEEAKEAAQKKTLDAGFRRGAAAVVVAADAASDPGYQSDTSDATTTAESRLHRRAGSDISSQTAPSTPPTSTAGDPNVNYAKTLRLTSDQLKALDLKPGENSMSFTVNRATCQANMFLWKHETPVVISDIDGTITKSDALGHVLNMIGRDWTHAGVAKLYSDIAANGYNIMYLTSRSVGQSDTTRAYLAGIQQDGYKLPRGPTILSPDRTMAALRREVYLRKPHVFKMATLRDIRLLYGPEHTPFYAGYGNRLTDQISYRTVDVPRNRIFTINSNAEVCLDVLSLNRLKLTYMNINEVVDHFFPPVSTLVRGGGEEFTDFKYWRDEPLELNEFSASDTEADDTPGRGQVHHDGGDDDEDEDEEDEDDEEAGDGLADSYISRDSSADEYDDDEGESELSESMEQSMRRLSLDESDADDEEEYEDEEHEGEGGDGEEEDDEDDGAATARPARSPPQVLEDLEDDDDDDDDVREEDVALVPTLSRPVNKELVQDVGAEAMTGVNNVTLHE